MEKHPDDLLTGDSEPFKGDPNFMASLARGLEVIRRSLRSARCSLFRKSVKKPAFRARRYVAVCIR